MNRRKLKKAMRLVEFPSMKEIMEAVKVTKNHEDGTVDCALDVPMFRIKAGCRHTKYAELWVRTLNEEWIEKLKERYGEEEAK